MNMEFNLGKKLPTRLLYLILFFLVLNILGIISKLYFNHDHIYGLIPLFDFNTEMNIPTLYSSFALVLASLLLAIISLIHKKAKTSFLPWLVLAVIFLFLSIDEIMMLHEKLTRPVRILLNTAGFFYYAWVIPYGVVLIVFVVAYLKFLKNLPKNIMILFVGSGTTFVTGAIGFELLGGWVSNSYGKNNLLYSLLYTCEEFLEMLGIVMFIYTLLTYIASQLDFLKITLRFNECRETDHHKLNGSLASPVLRREKRNTDQEVEI